MQYIQITSENLDKEHICCSISSNKDITVKSKKNWLRERLEDGLVFYKLDQRGKCFIEYIPAEKSFYGVHAPDFMHINCLWVSGSFKNNGHGKALLEHCINDSKAKGMKGLTVISSKKKLPFLADSSFLAHYGFIECDSADPYFTLMYLPFSNNVEKPFFLDSVKMPVLDDGFILYYSNGCPFTEKYVPLIVDVFNKHNISIKVIKLESVEDAKASPCAWTNFSLFYNKKLVTHEILSEKKTEEIINKLVINC